MTPTSISKRKTPSKYQSTDFPCPVFFRISGAKYAIDPQKEFVEAPSKTPCFDKPKSVNKACPSESMTTLSGFRSR